MEEEKVIEALDNISITTSKGNNRKKSAKALLSKKTTEEEFKDYVEKNCIPLTEMNRRLKAGILGKSVKVRSGDKISSGITNERILFTLVDIDGNETTAKLRTHTFKDNVYIDKSVFDYFVRTNQITN